MKKHGTAYASTMAVYEPGKPDTPTPAMLAVLEPALREQAEKEISQAKPLAPEDPILQRWGYLQENLRRLHKAGIPVVAGTDNGMPWTYHGWGSLHELELMVDGGLTPMQAIEAATRVSATALGENDRGTIEPGKLADLVLVDGKPDENIRDIEKTHTVLLAGKVIDRQKLVAAIQSPQMMPLPSREPEGLVDDMERSDLRTNLGTLVIPTTDAGADHSRILYQLVTREDGGHALGVFANMGPKKENYVRLDMPLTDGEVTLADLSKYKGIEFDVRGEGSFRLLVNTYDARVRDYYAAAFDATAQWHRVHIPFSELHTKSNTSFPWNPKSARSLLFEVTGIAGSNEWIELDNVRLF